MPGSIFPFMRLSNCSNGGNTGLVNRLRFLRNISSNASKARRIPRPPTAAQISKAVQPRAAARRIENSPGAFRPELFRFLNQRNPTPLVQSQTPLAYRIGMYMLGGFCLAYGAINYYTVLHDPPHELPRIVKATHISIDIAMVCMGVFCLYKTTRIISSVKVMPYVVNKATGQKGLMLQIGIYRTIPIPGRGPKVIQIPTSDVFTNGELGVPGMYNSTPLPPTRDEKIAERIFMRQQRRRDHQKNMSRLYTLPFRETGQFIGRAFTGFKDLIYGDGWVYLRAKSRNGTWRIGKDFDWALDNGHAFDKVVKVENF